jgi:hypothetical protein
MATAEAGSLRVDLAMNAGKFQDGARKVETTLDRLSSRARSLGLALGGAFVVGQFAGWATSALKAAGDAEASLATVQAIVKSTGGAAGMTTEKLVGMAQQLKALTNIDDDKILRDVTANLLTFTNVVGPTFREAQVAALNLSAVLRQDLQSSTIQLGKALNDPIKGITALRRVGVAFTASQREQIKTLMESGNILKAQGIILKELSKEFGGAAEAQAKTIEGRLNKVVVDFGDALEDVGKAMDRAGFLDLAQSVGNLAGKFGGLSPQMQTIIVVTGGVTAALLALGAVVGTIALIFGSFAIPFAAAAATIGVATGAIVAYWSEIKAAASELGATFAGVYEAARTWLVDQFSAAARATVAVAAWLQSQLQGVWDTITGAVGAVGAAFASIYEAGKLWLETNLGGVVDAVKAAIDGLTSAVMFLRDKFTDALETIGVKSEEHFSKVIARSKAMNQALIGEQTAWAAKTVEIDADLEERRAEIRVQAEAASEAAAARALEARKKEKAEHEKLIAAGVRLAEQVRTPTEEMVDNQKKIQAAFDAGKISAERYGVAMQNAAFVSANAYASMASGIASSLQQAFAKSKAVAIAVALINTYEAFTKALAAYPPPFNYVAAAAALAAGLAQVANIRKTTKDGGGGGGGGASSGGTASAATAAAQPQPTQGIYVSLEGEKFGREQIRGLIDQINSAQRDGYRIQMVVT